MGALTDLMCRLMAESNELRKKRVALGHYMHWRSVPRELSTTIRQYLLFLWDTNKDHDQYEDELKKKLTPVLRTELCRHNYGKILANLPFLVWMKDYTPCINF